MTITIIAAVTENGVIGKDGDLPWHLPIDLKRFMSITSGHTLIMGRKTFDSIGRKPLPNRRNIIVSRNPDFALEGVEAATSLGAALNTISPDESAYVVGGSAIYQEALSVADRMELTQIHATIEGDTLFPKFNASDWNVVNRERHEPDDRHLYAFSFVTYERKI